MDAREHHLAVTRTARYFALGEPGPHVRGVWFVLHGHGQLASHFIRPFAAIDDGTRLVLAPEALSRFYLEHSTWSESSKPRVGATWMTREDRLTEISDYIGYLDALHDRVFSEVDRETVSVTVLGFSQGVSTAARWLCRGKATADRFVVWAGPLPPELHAEDVGPLRRLRMTRVLGDKDEMASQEFVEAETERLRLLGLEAPLVRFPGGHQLSRDVLREIAR